MLAVCFRQYRDRRGDDWFIYRGERDWCFAPAEGRCFDGHAPTLEAAMAEIEAIDGAAKPELEPPQPTDPEADDELFPAPFITAGEALEQALNSLGLTLEPEPPRPGLPAQLAGLLLSAAAFIGLCAIAWGALNLALWALTLNAPGAGR